MENAFKRFVVILAGITGKIRRNDKQVYVFLICLFISSFIWLMIKFNKDYVHTLSFVVKQTNVPSTKTIKNLHSDTITLRMKAQGFKLIFNKLRSERTLLMDFSRTSWVKSDQDNVWNIPTRNLIENFSSQIPYTATILSIKPDTLYYFVGTLVEKKVPVVLNSSFSFKNQYGFYNSPLLTPDSVVISGKNILIDKVDSILTSRITFSDIEESIKTNLSLENPYPENLRLNAENVRLDVIVDKFTEKLFDVPVTIINNTDNEIKIMPAKVELKCLVPMSDYSSVTSADFEIVASVSYSIGNTSYIKLKVTQQHSRAKAIQLNPENVEYIIISQ